jgi:multicomponent Na+:H+ antiporter subunit D
VHITNHAFMKGTLFLCAGLLIKRAGIHNVSEMAGVAKRMPRDDGGLRGRGARHDRHAAARRLRQQVVPRLGILEVDEPLYLIVLLEGR